MIILLWGGSKNVTPLFHQTHSSRENMKIEKAAYSHPTVTSVQFKVEVGLELSNSDSFESMEENDESTMLTGSGNFTEGGSESNENTFGSIF